MIESFRMGGRRLVRDCEEMFSVVYLRSKGSTDSVALSCVNYLRKYYFLLYFPSVSRGNLSSLRWCSGCWYCLSLCIGVEIGFV